MITYDGYTLISGGVCAADGFTAAGMHAGIKKNGKPDLSLIFCERVCTASAVYTTNKVKGAPLLVTRRHLLDKKAQAIVVNSGNANTCNADGEEIAVSVCRLAAAALGVSANDVLVASTGVIGQPLSIEPFEYGIPLLAERLSREGSTDCVHGIMTTDTREKEVAVEFRLGGRLCRVGGICKGSGMINPNMATLLAFITTDVAIADYMLDCAVSTVCERTFNMLYIDGDTSTNDNFIVLSSGSAGSGVTTANDEINSFGHNYNIFVKALYIVAMNMAREMARDGEGATKLIECSVCGALSEDIARSVAKSVVSSDLLKCAVFAADANWGRVLCAIGYAEGNFDISKVEVEFASRFGRVIVCKNGVGVGFFEDDAAKVLSADEITISVNLHSGTESAVAWGCDLTYDYVKINADYRS